ncbi:hypothetical protein D024_0597 [Vibrio parahaemolyticus 3259]|nr:hypothetical protein D024_0597 [Vibrio parahaemolyticus 3259]ETJ89210.1 hypothetical protein D041_3469 [Vibrio parahaemolyticus EKP-008]
MVLHDALSSGKISNNKSEGKVWCLVSNEIKSPKTTKFY